MKQSKVESLVEAIINTFIGFIITIIFSPLIYHITNVPISHSQMGYTTLLFTVLSVIRSYVIRRYFNGKIFKFKRNDT